MAAKDIDHPRIDVVLRFRAGIELSPHLRRDLELVLPDQLPRKQGEEVELVHVEGEVQGGAGVQTLLEDFAQQVEALFINSATLAALVGGKYREVSIALIPNENMNAVGELPQSLIKLAATQGIDIYFSAL